jgi:mannose/fructose/N-acetylgalactosamine-specific phosphotransferase system component IIC
MIVLTALASLAALISLDITAFGQFMISRPIVCAPLFGYLLGDIKTGLWVGMMVELLWISFIPMGAAVPQDTTSIAILGTVWGLAFEPLQKGAVILGLIFSVLAGLLFRRIDVWMRYYNVKIMHWIEQGVAEGQEDRIDRGVYLGLFLFWLKAFIFYLVLLYPGQWVVRHLYPLLHEKLVAGLSQAWYLLPIVGMGLLLVKFYNGNLYYTKIRK